MSNRASNTIPSLEHLPRLIDWVSRCCQQGLQGGPIAVDVYRPEVMRDSVDNAKFHAIMSDIHRQAVISMPGRRVVMSVYDFEAAKTLLVMWYAKERELNGEPLSKPPRSIIDPMTGDRVQIRPSTTKWSKNDSSQFVHFLHALGDECGVMWGDPAMKEYEQYRESQNGT